MKTITLNKTSKLYVIKEGNGYSCLGFDVCFKRVVKLHKELNEITGFRIPQFARVGTLKLYKQYQQLLTAARLHNAKTGYQFRAELIPEFIGKEGYRVEVITAYDTKERFIIGKSTGFIPCHLEIKKSNSTGGAQVMGYPFKSINFLERAR